MVALFLIVQRRRGGQSGDTAIDIRPTTVALVAGVVIAIAQIAPTIEIPLFFQIAQRLSPLLATLAKRRSSSRSSFPGLSRGRCEALQPPGR